MSAAVSIEELTRQRDEALAFADERNKAAIEAQGRSALSAALAGSLAKQLTDRDYLIRALVSMLGPNALKVWQGWVAKGVKRVHHDWGPKAAEMTGEERAAVLLEWESAPRKLIERYDIDGLGDDNPPVAKPVAEPRP